MKIRLKNWQPPCSFLDQFVKFQPKKVCFWGPKRSSNFTHILEDSGSSGSNLGIGLSNDMAPLESIESRDSFRDPIETILFVDVDGVLNVGIYDPFDAPILLKSSELSLAREIVNMDYRGFDSATAYKICALAATPTDESGTTFESLASQDQLSKVLVGRLSELIQDAGPKCHVVLSSSWRKKQHMKKTTQAGTRSLRGFGKVFWIWCLHTAESRIACWRSLGSHQELGWVFGMGVLRFLRVLNIAKWMIFLGNLMTWSFFPRSVSWCCTISSVSSNIFGTLSRMRSWTSFKKPTRAEKARPPSGVICRTLLLRNT